MTFNERYYANVREQVAKLLETYKDDNVWELLGRTAST